jgi:hypothetical protein
MRNRVLFSTLITRRRGKIARFPGSKAARFSAQGAEKTVKDGVGGSDETKSN